MTRLLLIRHGEVEGIDPPIFRGRMDLPLTRRGVLQAQATAEHLAGRMALGTVYCSPLTRCVRTADILCERFQIAAITHPELNDISYGAWSGLSIDQVRGKWPEELLVWLTSPQLARIPGGESLQELTARATEALAGVLRKHLHGTLVLVTHDSVIRVLLCHALGLPLSSYWTFSPSPCGITRLAYVDQRFTLESFNETQHLTDL